ncbi:magnesium and cobalt transport protein CorA [Antribacter sp. KLBMP9083]|uniref:Magnesium and cobalt transport protein CorA n=1 Tax=Antribacter soli TaxID=2910976 RepID=A0AA41QD94_9MICO|nr:magnesium and cobalt transport protein CorA [Antribacter soli]MCF4120665.1 magnesium and cobalt transport protein CorA [Antribacter soli]
MTIMDNAVYVEGRRTANPVSLEETRETAHERGGIAWVDLYWPEPAEIQEVAAEFSLHRLAVEDAIHAHQRSKVERYDDVLYVVLRPVRAMPGELAEFGEVHAWVGPDFVVTVRRSQTPDLTAMRTQLELTPELLKHGPAAILVTLLDQVVNTYKPVLDRLRADIDEIEDKLFSRDPEVSLRIYQVTREVLDLQRAVHPTVEILRMLHDNGDTEDADIAQGHRYVELQRNLRNVLDHALRHAEASDTFRSLLTNALNVHSTLVTQEQNEEMRRMSELSLKQDEQVKKISAWAAIFFAPTVVGTIYGMNFDYMPETHWLWGYPLALGLMVGLGGLFYWVFKKVTWL